MILEVRSAHPFLRQSFFALGDAAVDLAQLLAALSPGSCNLMSVLPTTAAMPDTAYGRYREPEIVMVFSR